MKILSSEKKAKILKNQIEKLGIKIKLVAKPKQMFLKTLKEIDYSGMAITSFRNVSDFNYYNLLSSNRIPKREK